jgi:transcriptional regulator with XRE-family HTH domain
MLMYYTSLFSNEAAPPIMIIPAQMRAARALLGIDQRTLAEMSGVSLPTIQRMEASEGNVRGVVDTLTKVVEALNAAGIELISEHDASSGSGRGVRLKEAVRPRTASAEKTPRRKLTRPRRGTRVASKKHELP